MGGKVGIGGIKGVVGRLSSIGIVQNPDMYQVCELSAPISNLM